MNEILSQQDPRWANLPLGTVSPTAPAGTNPYLIWSKGCFVTELAQALSLTPDVVNQKLIAVNGYADDGTGRLSEVIWAKVAEAFPGYTATLISPYDNQAVLNNLAEGNKVLVEVSAAPIGGTGLHCVQYIGNEQCTNCWPNPATTVPTSFFPGVQSYVVITVPSVETTSPSSEVGEGTAQTETPASPVENAASETPVPGENTATLPAGWPATYQGLDMTNLQSVETAIDTWKSVANGEYVSATQYGQLVDQITGALGIDSSTDIQTIVQKVQTLKAGFDKQVTDSLVPAPANVEGTGTPVGTTVPTPTLKTLPASQKQTLLNHIEAFALGVKQELGITG